MLNLPAPPPKSFLTLVYFCYNGRAPESRNLKTKILGNQIINPRILVIVIVIISSDTRSANHQRISFLSFSPDKMLWELNNNDFYNFFKICFLWAYSPEHLWKKCVRCLILYADNKTQTKLFNQPPLAHNHVLSPLFGPSIYLWWHCLLAFMQCFPDRSSCIKQELTITNNGDT